MTFNSTFSQNTESIQKVIVSRDNQIHDLIYHSSQPMHRSRQRILRFIDSTVLINSTSNIARSSYDRACFTYVGKGLELADRAVKEAIGLSTGQEEEWKNS